jgi:hypothetical protein
MSTSWATSNIGALRRGRYWCAGTPHTALRVTCPYPFRPIRQPSGSDSSLLRNPDPVLRTPVFDSKTAVGRIQFP